MTWIIQFLRLIQGENYKHPYLKSNKAECFLAGTQSFEINEIEVFTHH